MNSYTNLFADLYGNTKLQTDKTQYLKYKNYLYARAVMDQFRTNCSDGTEIQMPNYNSKPDVSKYPFVKISHPEFLEYKRTIHEFVNSFNEFLKTLNLNILNMYLNLQYLPFQHYLFNYINLNFYPNLKSSHQIQKTH